jgi:hypothetical protein
VAMMSALEFHLPADNFEGVGLANEITVGGTAGARRGG